MTAGKLWATDRRLGETEREEEIQKVSHLVGPPPTRLGEFSSGALGRASCPAVELGRGGIFSNSGVAHLHEWGLPRSSPTTSWILGNPVLP